ncbi:hypothetical protein [Jannaschia seohaensis]|uniref:Uncharacterized protein n=1 Tax=Jannaschia seohaensis TaxID=475081 RepID=A0A2Y9B1L4_9RHOB|nr:hypothetical protein [Jannaschia seohaensis]PWJ13803.1 hypothetical protein BCF38_11334 [Jannaschia seohaensis]SSA50316.1 hypothetical protein SAMN05421539_11334 [Jannaschia seohaensis]
MTDARDLTSILAADCDDAFGAAAGDFPRRWSSQGRRLPIARPPRGTDFDDLLLLRLSMIEGTVK